jgi:hypothetical protein
LVEKQWRHHRGNSSQAERRCLPEGILNDEWPLPGSTRPALRSKPILFSNLHKFVIIMYELIILL